MLKVFLINPPIHNFLGDCRGNTTPLGLMYLAAVLEKAGYQPKILDAESAMLNWEELTEKIKQENPDIIGIGGTSLGLPALYKTVEICQRVAPQAKIITGGSGTTFEPNKILKNLPAVEVVVMGEGEKTILELMNYFEGKKNLKEIKGIAYRNNNEIVINQPQEFIEDLNSLPLPAYHLLEPTFLAYTGTHHAEETYGIKTPNAVIMASRGCPHRCIFCSNGQVKNRRRDPQKVVDEIEFCLKLGAKSFQFYDDEFVGTNPTQNRWIEAICDEIIKRKLNHIAYIVQGRCSPFVELKTLKKMKEAGFVWIWWGVESGSQKVLDRIKKDTTIKDIKNSFQLAKEAGIKSLMFIMVGLPGETEEDVLQTGKLIEEIKPDQVRFHITTPFPGSAIWEELKVKNQIEDYDFLHYNTRGKAVHHTDTMSAAKIEEAFRLLVWRYESKKINFVKMFFRSFLSFKEFKKLPTRIRKVLVFVPRWLKIKLMPSPST